MSDDSYDAREEGVREDMMRDEYEEEIRELRDQLGEALVRENNLIAENASLGEALATLELNNHKLRAALEKIADTSTWQHMKKIARAAIL